MSPPNQQPQSENDTFNDFSNNDTLMPPPPNRFTSFCPPPQPTSSQANSAMSAMLPPPARPNTSHSQTMSGWGMVPPPPRPHGALPINGQISRHDSTSPSESSSRIFSMPPPMPRLSSWTPPSSSQPHQGNGLSSILHPNPLRHRYQPPPSSSSSSRPSSTNGNHFKIENGKRSQPEPTTTTTTSQSSSESSTAISSEVRMQRIPTAVSATPTNGGDWNSKRARLDGSLNRVTFNNHPSRVTFGGESTNRLNQNEICAASTTGRFSFSSSVAERCANHSNAHISMTLPPSHNAIDLTLDSDEEDAVNSNRGIQGMRFDSSNSTETHVIFAIDFSGSMKEQDVRAGRGKISRWEAVFQCMDSFLTNQLQQQQQDDNRHSNCIVSVLRFNNESEILVKRMPLSGTGREVRDALEKAKAFVPRGGTSFSAAFKTAQELADGGLDTSNKEHNVILVFLTDGRPGDLQRPPSNPQIPMQETFRFHRQTYPAAGTYIEHMQKQKYNFSLQLICLFNEGKPWMNYLARRYNGAFHNPDLSLDDNNSAGAVAQVEPADSEEEEEVIEMKVKSNETLIREKYQKAKATGDVVSLTSATTSSSSIRSTFLSISSTVTAMRGSKLQERNVQIQSESFMIGFEATRMVLSTDASGAPKFVVAPHENSNDRRIHVSMHPFAQGGLRNVYRMKQSGEMQQVAKESRHDIKYQERLKFHLETVQCQARAGAYARKFNKAIKELKGQRDESHSIQTVPSVDMLRAEVYRLKDPSCPGGFRYLAVEKEMKGNYEKWNNNDGYVNPDNCLKCQVAQALSHFSYKFSKRKEMVVDIQGTGFVFTDPQIHSVEKSFGRADRGANGFDKFFKTHECNFICKELGLHIDPADENAPEETVIKTEKKEKTIRSYFLPSNEDGTNS